MIRLIFVFIFSLVLAGCEKTPMQKLASDQVYSDMNNAFWAKEQEKKTQLWEQAVEYCKQNSEKPNCQPVNQVLVITNGTTTAPAIGHSGNSLSSPNF